MIFARTPRALSFEEVVHGNYEEEPMLSDEIADLSFQMKVAMVATFGLIAVGIFRMVVQSGVPLI